MKRAPWIALSLVLLLLGLMPRPAHAIAIMVDILEPPAEGGIVNVITGLPNCGLPPCRDAAQSRAQAERAQVTIRLPAGFFPAAINPKSGRVFLREPPGGVDGISDFTNVNVTVGGAFDILSLFFVSDGGLPSGPFPTPPPGFPALCQPLEMAGPQNVTGQFCSLDAPFNPVVLTPAAAGDTLTIRLQSDLPVIPEPSTLLLVGSGLAVLGMRLWRYRRSERNTVTVFSDRSLD